MAHQNHGSKLEAVMELLIENGFESFADVLSIMLNEAKKIERDHVLRAGPYTLAKVAEDMPMATSRKQSIPEWASSM